MAKKKIRKGPASTQQALGGRHVAGGTMTSEPSRFGALNGGIRGQTIREPGSEFPRETKIDAGEDGRGLYAGPPTLWMRPGDLGRQITFPNRARRGLGWVRDLPDFRDSTLFNETPTDKGGEVKTQVYRRATAPIRRRSEGAAALAPAVDHSEFCSPVEDQGDLGSCTAHACVGMVEYMEKRAGGPHVDAARLFLYKITRKLLRWKGDTGATLRSTMKALVMFGVPPEEWWPYDVSTFEMEPDAFMYSYAANYKAIQYFRLDAPTGQPEETLKHVKSALATGYAVMFGFTVYNSLSSRADIPFPGPKDKVEGGHAVLAVGYDDSRPVYRGAAGRAAPDVKGALLIRNSWGQAWGDTGYGWLPYEYVLKGLAADFWTCTDQRWIETNKFD